MKTLGVLTSGGDAPGMNACIAAIADCAEKRGARVRGIFRGFVGLLGGEPSTHRRGNRRLGTKRRKLSRHITQRRREEGAPTARI